jgi:hypothetical protein
MDARKLVDGRTLRNGTNGELLFTLRWFARQCGSAKSSPRKCFKQAITVRRAKPA